jgi:SAM-dependent methyltransferase
MTQKFEWHKEFFNTLYYELFLKRTEEKAKKDAHNIEYICHIDKPSLILEQCCGIGDVAHHLANNQHEVYAIDYSKEYIDIGLDKFSNVNFVCDNALNYQFTDKLGQFDYVTNWYSSFGYFDHENNLQLIRNAFQHLKNGGIYLIDMYNTVSIFKNFKSLFEYDFFHNNKEIYVKRNSQIDFENMLMLQKWEYFFNGKKEYEQNTTLSLYSSKEMIIYLKEIGFSEVTLVDENHLPLSIDSQRLKIIARK